MVPLLRMLDFHGFSLSDAEAGGFEELADAAARCRRCLETNACIRWLKWHGRNGQAPCCLNAGYFHWLRKRFL